MIIYFRTYSPKVSKHNRKIQEIWKIYNTLNIAYTPSVYIHRVTYIYIYIDGGNNNRSSMIQWNYGRLPVGPTASPQEQVIAVGIVFWLWILSLTIILCLYIHRNRFFTYESPSLWYVNSDFESPTRTWNILLHSKSILCRKCICIHIYRAKRPNIWTVRPRQWNIVATNTLSPWMRSSSPRMTYGPILYCIITSLHSRVLHVGPFTTFAVCFPRPYK